MISLILSLFGKGLLGQVLSEISGAYKERLQAANETERIEADKYIAVLNTQREILVSEMKNSLTSWVRPAFCGIFFVYLFKTVIWDKVLELGVTDILSAQQEYIMYGFLGVYFIGRPLEKMFGKK